MTIRPYLEDWIFRFIGVNPSDRKHRDNIDWFYLTLWIASVGYQILLLHCFFLASNSRVIRFMDLMAEPYLIAVEGYGIFNIVYHYKHDDHRRHNIKVAHERRKTRNGHRFIIYWWINFLMMTLAANFKFKYSLYETPGTSLKIAVCCTVIGIGYKYAKNKWNHSRR